jgi:hypothetical protein
MIFIMIMIKYKIIKNKELICLKNNQKLNLFGCIYHVFYGLRKSILKIINKKCMLKESKIYKNKDFNKNVIYVD